MKTELCEVLGIEYPIIQGAMAHITDGKFAAAVSNAGGLGIIACGAAPVSWVKAEIEKARELTDKPIGLNIMLMNPEAPQLAQLAADMKVDVVTQVQAILVLIYLCGKKQVLRLFLLLLLQRWRVVWSVVAPMRCR